MNNENEEKLNTEEVSDEQGGEIHSERRFKRDFILLRALIISLLIFASYKILTCSGWVYPSNTFDYLKSRYFTISGYTLTTPDKVLEALRKEPLPKVPLYMINPKDFEKRIMKIATVKRVYVRRYWFPARMRVVIEDKKPLMTISRDEKSKPIMFFVEDGKLLSMDYMTPDVSLYPVNVIAPTEKNNNFFDWKPDVLAGILNISDTIAKYAGESPEYIDCRNMNDIFVKVDDVLLRVGEPDVTLEKRLKYTSTILGYVKKHPDKIEYIDLRWNDVQFIKYKGNTKNESTEIIDTGDTEA